jgi:hypothetical protein
MESRVLELIDRLILIVPGMLLGWAAVRRAEALVIWAKRRSPRSDGTVR